MVKGKQSKPGSIINLEIKDKYTLYTSYMPYLKNGGLFIATKKAFELGDEIFIILTLLEDPEQIPVSGKVVWITPTGAQGNKSPGIGVQFRDNGAARNKIETLLGGALKSDRQTDTM